MLSKSEKAAIQNSQTAQASNNTANVPQSGINFNGMVFRQGKSSEFGHSYLVGVLSSNIRANVGRATSKETTAVRESDFFPNGIVFQSRKKNCEAEDIHVGSMCSMMVGGNKECTMTGMKPGTFIKLMNLSAQRSKKEGKAPATFLNASAIIEESRYDGLRVRQIGGATILDYALAHGLIPEKIPAPSEAYKQNAADHNDYMPVVPCMLIPFGEAYQEKMKAAGIKFSLVENPQEAPTFKYVSTLDTSKKNAVLRVTLHGKNTVGDPELFKLRMAYYSESFINFGVSEKVPNGFEALTKFFLPVLKDMDHVVYAQRDIKNTTKMEENSAQYLQMMLNAVSEDSDSDDDDEDTTKKMEAEKAEKAKNSYKFGHALQTLTVFFDYKKDLLEKFFIPVSHAYVQSESSKGHIKNAMTAEMKKEADEIASHAYCETGAVVMNFTTDEAKKMLRTVGKKLDAGKTTKVKYYAMSWTMLEVLGSVGVKKFVEKFGNLTPEEGAGLFAYLVDREEENVTPALKAAIDEVKQTRLSEKVLMESTIVLVAYKPQNNRCNPVKFLDTIFGFDSFNSEKKRGAEDAPPANDAESEDKKQKTDEA